MTDRQLLERYVAGEEAAFAEVVRRHGDLVYGAARRQVGASAAEDVTQAVFMVLAEKARGLRGEGTLAGWLYKVAGYCCGNYRRSETLRRRRETEAAMRDQMKVMETETDAGCLLDAALQTLGRKERQAVLLRYMEGQGGEEAATAAGISEEAVRKRAQRGLEKLRVYFARHGYAMESAGVAGVLASAAGMKAPVTMWAVLTGSGGGGATAGMLAKAASKALFWSKLKMAAGAAAATILVGLLGVSIGGSVTRAEGSGAGTPATAPAVAANGPATGKAGRWPLLIPNSDLVTNNAVNGITTELDAATKRTETSHAAIHILSTVANPMTGQTGRVAYLPVMELGGKRVRVTGWVKTQDLEGWAGVNLLVTDNGGHIYSSDNMEDRPIHGTTEWKQYATVADVPKEATVLVVGVLQVGRGESWADDLEIDVVGKDVETTDDSSWHKAAPYSPNYTMSMEEGRENRQAVCMAYTGPQVMPQGAWTWYGKCDRDPVALVGKRIKMSAWVKFEGITRSGGPNIRPKGANFKLLAEDNQRRSGRPWRGSEDWEEWSVECDIPKGTQCIDSGFVFNGKGKVWIDMASVKYEVIGEAKDPPAPLPAGAW